MNQDQEWFSISEISRIARLAMQQRYPEQAGPIDRLDVHPDKGMVKVLLKGFWEVQVDGYSGEALSIARRHSDWIEKIHDGSILGDSFKLWSMNTLGLWQESKPLRRLK